MRLGSAKRPRISHTIMLALKRLEISVTVSSATNYFLLHDWPIYIDFYHRYHRVSFPDCILIYDSKWRKSPCSSFIELGVVCSQLQPVFLFSEGHSGAEV
jgi:hypothetical protein